jgi:mRNA-degrading endonuclease RelE of RelBE toxin-antitoxin system
MSPGFSLRTTRRFDRLARSLRKHHPGAFTDQLEAALAILSADPHNRSARHPIRKLQGVPQGEGQYRLRLGRWRFRYDVLGNEVVLHYTGLRREDTYR